MNRTKRTACFAAMVLAAFLLAGTVQAASEDVGADTVKVGDEKGWIKLLDTNDFSKWREPTGDWRIVEGTFLDPNDDTRLGWTSGTGVAVNGIKGNTKHLVSKLEHADVEAHIEFMVPKGSNSGVYFMGRYEIQVFDSWGVEKPKYSDCGGIYERWKDNKGYEGKPPRTNASRKPGEWQRFDVHFKAPRFDENGKKISNAEFVRVFHNGVLIHEREEVTGPTRAAIFEDEKPRGPLMLQGDHGPVAYANVRIRPLKEETAYERLPAYEFGDDRDDLAAIEEDIRGATPARLREIEGVLIDVIESEDATIDSKRFACRMLRRIGTEACVPAVAELLTNPALSHMARYALQGNPSPKVDAELRKALVRTEGEVKAGIISTISVRRDKEAVPLLVECRKSDDPVVAKAAEIALDRIGWE